MGRGWEGELTGSKADLLRHISSEIVRNGLGGLVDFAPSKVGLEGWLGLAAFLGWSV
jgi:hypothetical protein